MKNVTSIKNKNGETITSGNIGTGSKVVADGKEYTVIKLGDVNGDGEIDIIDLALMKREIVGSQKLDGIYKIAGNISEKRNIRNRYYRFGFTKKTNIRNTINKNIIYWRKIYED